MVAVVSAGWGSGIGGATEGGGSGAGGSMVADVYAGWS
jgi:hypothetical protein